MWCVSCDQQVMSPEEYAHHMFVEGKTQAANASCETMSSTQPLSNPESSSKESADEHTNESLAVQSWSFAPAASADARKADVGSAVCSLSSELCALTYLTNHLSIVCPHKLATLGAHTV
eukprot:SAG31_NODE_1651_length_7634_cov_5.579562_8_plen_119_part_00